ncbi:hypothetical protein GCM10009115_17580 [Sphingopyxis soli]|uniref:Uncharacterized protein n=1 Tax=Sphingopyxis soli TaxID=592051 RepID=A0ABN1M4H5_9SPHN|nr:hypothetical protein [Sphingopyxis soli]
MTEDDVIRLIAIHNGDPDAHDVIPPPVHITLAYDAFERADGALGSPWTSVSGLTLAVIDDAAMVSPNGTAAGAFQPSARTGTTIITASMLVGNADCWLYGWFASGVGCVAVQRGSDRFRIWTINGVTLSMVAEHPIFFKGLPERVSLRLDSDNLRATLIADSEQLLDVALPDQAYGNSVGARIGGTASIIDFAAVREIQP